MIIGRFRLVLKNTPQTTRVAVLRLLSKTHIVDCLNQTPHVFNNTTLPSLQCRSLASPYFNFLRFFCKLMTHFIVQECHAKLAFLKAHNTSQRTVNLQICYFHYFRECFKVIQHIKSLSISDVQVFPPTLQIPPIYLYGKYIYSLPQTCSIHIILRKHKSICILL